MRRTMSANIRWRPGQVYGLRNGQFEHKRQMPVEECGNMLIMTAAACRADGNFALARANLALLERWAGYLQTGGQDPDEQLCTDDFAGHLNHNANLSVKAIIGLGAYALILEACGEGERAAAYRRLAAAMAARWQEMAADGDHTRLTFDRPATWSMKYNLLFDRLLSLNLFPTALGETEIDAYLRRQNRYGLPLDSARRLHQVRLAGLVRRPQRRSGQGRQPDRAVIPVLL